MVQTDRDPEKPLCFWLKLRKSGGGTLGFLSLHFLHFLMPQPAGTSVAGAVMAVAGAAMRQDACRKEPALLQEWTLLLPWWIIRSRSPGQTSLLFGLSLYPSTTSWKWAVSGWRTYKGNQKMLGRSWKERSSGKQPCKVVYELLDSPQTCMRGFDPNQPNTLRTQLLSWLLPRSQTNTSVVLTERPR